MLCLSDAAVEKEDLIGVPRLTVEVHLLAGLTGVEEEGQLRRLSPLPPACVVPEHVEIWKVCRLLHTGTTSSPAGSGKAYPTVMG